MFTSQFLPTGTREQWDALNELQRRTTSPDNAVRFLEVFAEIDVVDEASDGQQAVRLASASPYDVVVGDAFGGLAVPWHLTTREFFEEVRDGVWAVGAYSGTGNVVGAVCGRAVARAAFGERTVALELLGTGN